MGEVMRVSAKVLTDAIEELRSRQVRLSTIKPGQMFMTEYDTLVLMTEYGDSDQPLKGYIVGTGERYWPRLVADPWVIPMEVRVMADQPQAQIERDDHTDGARMTAKQRAALVNYLRYLVWGFDSEGDEDGQLAARHMFEWEWPELCADVFAEATRDAEGGG